jgi:NADH dehydrogenase FAD-containing subunit
MVCILYSIEIFKFSLLGCVVQAEVLSISNTGIQVNGRNEPIHFDYLVIATGSSYAFPGKVAETEISKAIDLYDNIRGKIEKSRQILIIGGGAVGIELAGEIAADFPTKDITLVHSQPILLQPNIYREKIYTGAQEQLEKLNVKIILNDRIELPNKESTNYIEGKKTYTTLKSKTNITADLTFICTGARVNNKSILSSPLKTKLNPQTGRIIVNNYLQVDGYENIFAIGDISDKEDKFAFFAGEQGEYVAKLIPLIEKKKPYPKEYPVHTNRAIFLTIGRNGGIGQLPTKGGTILGK